LQKEVYEESRCYPLCFFSTCFLFMLSLVSYSSICLLVFMLTLIFIYCIFTFFFFVYHFSCYIFVLFFFNCLLFFIFYCCANFLFLGQIFFSIAFVEVLVSSKFFLFVEFCWCKTCHHFVALYFYSSQLWCVGLFFVFKKKKLSFCSHCCACVFYYWHMCFLSLIYTSEDHDEKSFSSPILVFSQKKFALYFVDACISCNTFYLYCILFKCTYFVSLPLKKAFEWKKIGFLKHNWRHIHKTIILIPWILRFFFLLYALSFGYFAY
jgi:hypothetical protein